MNNSAEQITENIYKKISVGGELQKGFLFDYVVSKLRIHSLSDTGISNNEIYSYHLDAADNVLIPGLRKIIGDLGFNSTAGTDEDVINRVAELKNDADFLKKIKDANDIDDIPIEDFADGIVNSLKTQFFIVQNIHVCKTRKTRSTGSNSIMASAANILSLFHGIVIKVEKEEYTMLFSGLPLPIHVDVFGDEREQNETGEGVIDVMSISIRHLDINGNIEKTEKQILPTTTDVNFNTICSYVPYLIMYGVFFLEERNGRVATIVLTPDGRLKKINPTSKTTNDIYDVAILNFVASLNVTSISNSDCFTIRNGILKGEMHLLCFPIFRVLDDCSIYPLVLKTTRNRKKDRGVPFEFEVKGYIVDVLTEQVGKSPKDRKSTRDLKNVFVSPRVEHTFHTEEDIKKFQKNDKRITWKHYCAYEASAAYTKRQELQKTNERGYENEIGKLGREYEMFAERAYGSVAKAPQMPVNVFTQAQIVYIEQQKKLVYNMRYVGNIFAVYGMTSYHDYNITKPVLRLFAAVFNNPSVTLSLVAAIDALKRLYKNDAPLVHVGSSYFLNSDKSFIDKLCGKRFTSKTSSEVIATELAKSVINYVSASTGSVNRKTSRANEMLKIIKMFPLAKKILSTNGSKISMDKVENLRDLISLKSVEDHAVKLYHNDKERGRNFTTPPEKTYMYVSAKTSGDVILGDTYEIPTVSDQTTSMVIYDDVKGGVVTHETIGVTEQNIVFEDGSPINKHALIRNIQNPTLSFVEGKSITRMNVNKNSLMWECDNKISADKLISVDIMINGKKEPVKVDLSRYVETCMVAYHIAAYGKRIDKHTGLIIGQEQSPEKKLTKQWTKLMDIFACNVNMRDETTLRYPMSWGFDGNIFMHIVLVPLDVYHIVDEFVKDYTSLAYLEYNTISASYKNHIRKFFSLSDCARSMVIDGSDDGKPIFIPKTSIKRKTAIGQKEEIMLTNCIKITARFVYGEKQEEYSIAPESDGLWSNATHVLVSDMESVYQRIRRNNKNPVRYVIGSENMKISVEYTTTAKKILSLKKEHTYVKVENVKRKDYAVEKKTKIGTGNIPSMLNTSKMTEETRIASGVLFKDFIFNESAIRSLYSHLQHENHSSSNVSVENNEIEKFISQIDKRLEEEYKSVRNELFNAMFPYDSMYRTYTCSQGDVFKKIALMDKKDELTTMCLMGAFSIWNNHMRAAFALKSNKSGVFQMLSGETKSYKQLASTKMTDKTLVPTDFFNYAMGNLSFYVNSKSVHWRFKPSSIPDDKTVKSFLETFVGTTAKEPIVQAAKILKMFKGNDSLIKSRLAKFGNIIKMLDIQVAEEFLVTEKNKISKTSKHLLNECVMLGLRDEFRELDATDYLEDFVNVEMKMKIHKGCLMKHCRFVIPDHVTTEGITNIFDILDKVHVTVPLLKEHDADPVSTVDLPVYENDVKHGINNFTVTYASDETLSVPLKRKTDKKTEEYDSESENVEEIPMYDDSDISDEEEEEEYVEEDEESSDGSSSEEEVYQARKGNDGVVSTAPSHRRSKQSSTKMKKNGY